MLRLLKPRVSLSSSLPVGSAIISADAKRASASSVPSTSSSAAVAPDASILEGQLIMAVTVCRGMGIQVPHQLQQTLLRTADPSIGGRGKISGAFSAV